MLHQKETNPKSVGLNLAELGSNPGLPTPSLSPHGGEPAGSLLAPPPLAVCLPSSIPEGPSLLPFPLADFLAHEAQFVVTIGSVTGVLDTSVLDPEPGPQGPFITYSYYVTYDFVEDEEGEGSEYVEGVLAEVCAPAGLVLGMWGGGLCPRVHGVSLKGRTASSGPGKS